MGGALQLGQCFALVEIHNKVDTLPFVLATNTEVTPRRRRVVSRCYAQVVTAATTSSSDRPPHPTPLTLASGKLVKIAGISCPWRSPA